MKIAKERSVKRIIANPRKCLACRSCELACAEGHSGAEDLLGAIRAAAKPRIYIESAGGLAVPLQCRHCEDAPCIRVCPAAALWRLNPGAPVLVENERCVGCGFCVQACPFGVIRVVRAPAASGGMAVVKCDLCQARQAEGLLPACVSACPVRALAFEEVDEGAKKSRWRAAARILAASASDQVSNESR